MRCILRPLRGVPIPPRPWGRRDSGASVAVWGWMSLYPGIDPTGHPYPSAAQAGPEGLGCNNLCVGVGDAVYPQTPTGCPYPSAAQAGPVGLGCNHRCVGVGDAVYPQTPMGRPSPSAARQDRRDSSVTAAVRGWAAQRTLSPPGASLSLRGQSRTGGTRV